LKPEALAVILVEAKAGSLICTPVILGQVLFTGGGVGGGGVGGGVGGVPFVIFVPFN